MANPYYNVRYNRSTRVLKEIYQVVIATMVPAMEHLAILPGQHVVYGQKNAYQMIDLILCHQRSCKLEQYRKNDK